MKIDSNRSNDRDNFLLQPPVRVGFRPGISIIELPKVTIEVQMVSFVALKLTRAIRMRNDEHPKPAKEYFFLAI
jgi:hypothetical protein